VEELKNLLKQRHEERVNHRQELREAYGKLEAQASAQNQEDQRASHQEQKESDEEAMNFWLRWKNCRGTWRGMRWQ